MPRSLRAALNEANPNKLPNGCQQIRLGDRLAAGPVFASGAVASNTLVLPEDAKALYPVVGFIRAGTGTGILKPAETLGTPAAGEVGVSPSGDLIFAAGDAITAVEVHYVGADGEIYTDVELGVVSNVATLPVNALMLVSAEVTAGTAAGVKTVLARGASPAAGQAALNAAGTGVAFAGADGAQRVKLTFIAAPDVNVGTETDL